MPPTGRRSVSYTGALLRRSLARCAGGHRLAGHGRRRDRCRLAHQQPADDLVCLRRDDALSLIQVLFCGVLSPVALAAIALPATAADEIAAGSLTNSPPMISYASDGTTLQGMIVDLAAAMGKAMGKPIVFKPMAFNAIMPAMEATNIDIAFTVMNDTPEREQVID